MSTTVVALPLECSRRLQLALNTVKRYARASQPERMIRAPQYRPTLVDPYRDYLKKRRADEPNIAIRTLFSEIKKQGYPGSTNLLSRYITQGRVENNRCNISPRRLAKLMLTNPAQLDEASEKILTEASTACAEMTALTGHIRTFARLLAPGPENAALLDSWINAVGHDDLPYLHTFTRGITNDYDAITAAFTLPYHNGGTEGVNNKIKLLKRQMYGRAAFRLLRKRILLN